MNPEKNIKKLDKPSVILPTFESEELLDLQKIITDALARILSLKTKKTFQQEVQFISKTIQDYINISYVPKVEHENELLEQLFYMINYLKKIKGNKEIDEAIIELEKIAKEEK